MNERITRGKAIRLKCLDCCCGNAAEVRKCVARNCPLYAYRLGKECRDISQDGEPIKKSKSATTVRDSDGRMDGNEGGKIVDDKNG